MKSVSFKMGAVFLLLLTGCLVGGWARADVYPSRPVHFIVPFPAGGPTDVLSRAVAERIEARTRQPIVVENKAGANTIIGANAVARAPADGYTFLVGTDVTYTVNPLLYAKLPYDPHADLVPVTIMAHVPASVMVRAGLGLRNFKEFEAYAKANPGKLTYGSVGVGSSQHLAGAALSRALGIEMVHVPFKGAPEVFHAMLSGELDMVITSPNSALQFIAQGKIVQLATSAPARMKKFPGLPTYRELGISGLDTNVWFGLLAPAGTPPSVIETMASYVDEIVASPEFQEKNIRSFTMEPPPAGGKTSYFKEVLAADSARYARFVKDAGLKPQ